MDRNAGNEAQRTRCGSARALQSLGAMQLPHLTPDESEQYRPGILLAEDDDAFRALLATQLRADGYRVVDVRSGSAALERLLRHASQDDWHLDLVVTDINMPGLTGLDLASVLRHDRVPTRLVCFTAFARTHSSATTARLTAPTRSVRSPMSGGFRSANPLLACSGPRLQTVGSIDRIRLPSEACRS